MYGSTLVILVVVVLAYILFGGAVFMALEKDNEIAMTNIVSSNFKYFIGKNTLGGLYIYSFVIFLSNVGNCTS